jgi:hypothetical protein
MIRRILAVTAVLPAVLHMSAVAAQKEEPAVYASWKALRTAKPPTGKKPAKDVTVLGHVRCVRTGSFRFAPAAGDRFDGVMTVRGATNKLTTTICDAAGKDGAVPALLTGNLTVTPARPGPGGPFTTGVYRGPFYRFTVREFEPVSTDEARALAKKLVPDEAARSAFLRRVVPIRLGTLRVFITQLSVHEDNPRDKAFSSGVVVGVSVVNGAGRPARLRPPAVSVEIDGEQRTGRLRRVPGGYLDGPAVVSKAGGGRRCAPRWSYKLSEPVKGGQQATVTLSFHGPGGTKRTRTERVTVAAY